MTSCRKACARCSMFHVCITDKITLKNEARLIVLIPSALNQSWPLFTFSPSIHSKTPVNDFTQPPPTTPIGKMYQNVATESCSTRTFRSSSMAFCLAMSSRRFLVWRRTCSHSCQRWSSLLRTRWGSRYVESRKYDCVVLFLLSNFFSWVIGHTTGSLYNIIYYPLSRWVPHIQAKPTNPPHQIL